jgi:hypothetical protein
MRQTEHTLECDRCGTTETVGGWHKSVLTPLAELGWSSYLPSWLGGKCIKPTQDLCPTCTVKMNTFMKTAITVTYFRVSGPDGTGHGSLVPTTQDKFGVRIADLGEATGVMLTDLRKNINAELRLRRKDSSQ